MKKRMELTGREWALIKVLLPPEKGQRGRPSKNNRLIVNAILWVMRTGVPAGFT
ncbi:transposase [Desulfobotulus sp. H1]|uniref:Transposase n=1 Tax=Desulfobotulus pelophilus TaxID=2823377 RepID=A0ABT3NCV1_9BACT|nr:transposase [Desulfobotulus pelophilus]MCW7755293.1 transposase [Desulfobotulus pelophilus]